LISFILYGDPLAQPDANGSRPKCVRYRNNPLAAVRTVCDKTTRQPGAPPAQVMASVKQVVSSYLPGMSDAQVLYAPERDNCNGDGHSCPTSQLNDGLEDAASLPDSAPVLAKGGAAKGGPERGQRSPRGRSLVTLSKQHKQPGGVHTEVARLTLDEDGKLVKLVVSR
jgi:hypothetical protein